MNDKTVDSGLAWAILAVMFGCLLCFAGYRLWRFSAVAIAFMTGAALFVDGIFMALSYETIPNSLAYWLLYVLLGGVVGFAAAVLPGFGVFLVGFTGGVQVANALLSLLAFSGSRISCFICLLSVGTIFGVLTLKFQKPALVTATSLLGAVTILSGVTHWSDVSLYSEPLFRKATNTEITSWTFFFFYLALEPDSVSAVSLQLQIASWTLLLVLLGLFASGLLVQFRITGRGTHHLGHQVSWCAPREAPEHRQADDEAHARISHYEIIESPREVKRWQAGEDVKNLQVVDQVAHV